MAYNTGNPIGSTDARDLYDNATNLDKAVNQFAARWTDRLGVSRPSWAGIAAYADLGDYAGGLQISGYNEIFRHDGEYYKVLSSTSLPYTTTGSWSDDAVYFGPIGDALLRQDLTERADDVIGYYRNAINCNGYGGLEAALADSDTIGKIIIVTDDQTITSSIETSGRKVVVEFGGLITVDSGQTLTINAPFQSGLYQVFDGDGSVVFGSGSVTEVYPKWFGATGSAGENLSTILAKFTGGSRVVVSNASITFSPDINAPGITLVGTGSTIITSGSITGATLSGIYYDRKPNIKKTSFLAPSHRSSAPMLFEKRAGNRFYIQKAIPNGIAEFLLQDGIGTSASSYGAPFGLVRVTSVTHYFDTILALNTVSASTLTTLNYGPAVGFASNIERYIVENGHTKARSSATGLNYHKVDATGTIDYVVPVLDNGMATQKGNVAFFTSSTSSASVSILVNGKTVVSGISLAESTNRVKIVSFDIPFSDKSGTVTSSTIQVVNSGATQAYVICANLARLADVDRLWAFDFFKSFGSGVSYRSNTGAADYAIYDEDAGYFCGSYHGGETSIGINLKLDGVDYDLATASGDIRLVRGCDLFQTTNIVSKLTTAVLHSFSTQNGYDLSVSMRGSMNVSAFHTAMATTDEAFNYVLSPKYIDTTTIGDYELPECSSVIQRYISGTAAYTSEIQFEQFDKSFNSRGGPFITHSAGNYNKVYAPAIIDNLVNITEINFRTKHLFY